MKLLGRLGRSRSQPVSNDRERLQTSLRQLDILLDRVLQQFSQKLSVAELLLYIPRLEYLVTVAIRPDTAPILPTRVRASAKTVLGTVLNTRVQFHGLVTNDSGQPRMLETLQVRVIPITLDQNPSQRFLGVLNLESKERGALSEQSPQALDQLLKEISAVMAGLAIIDFATNKDLVDFLLDMVEKRLAYILDPEQRDEIYHQIRLAAAGLTSQSDVVVSIILRQREAFNLGFADENPDPARGASSGQIERHEWVYPIANKGDALTFPAKWDLMGEPSITRKAMETGRIQNIRDVSDVSIGPERKRVNPAYDHGSELNIPLSNGGDCFGALILLSTVTHAFSDDDVLSAARIARCVELITLGFEKHLIILRPLSSQQLAVKQAIYVDIERLYTSRSFTSMPDIRDKVLQYIASNAKEHTGADVAAVVLAEEASNSEEQASDGEEELVWSMKHCASEIGAPSVDKPFRLKKTEGLIGIAYTTGKPIRERNVHNPDNPALKDKYVEAFHQVNSEMVIPLKGRRRTWGVIDVESVQPDHFTHGHQEWVEFLAAEAVNLLEALELATRRWFQERLVMIDTALATMRESKDLVEIQKKRQDLLQTLLQDTRDLTGASTAQIYVVVNMYQDLDAPDKAEPAETVDADPHEGVLGAVIVSPTRLMDEKGFHRNIRITQGMAGKVVASKRRLFFKDRSDRPPEYIPNPIDAESALVVPILEGHRVIAVLNMESDVPRWCGNLQIEIAEYAASLIANILVAYRLSVEMLQAEMLLTFNAHWESPNVTKFMRYVLRFADELTASLDPLRWGQLALVEDSAISYIVSGQFPDSFSDEENQSTQHLPVAYSVFQRVLHDKKPALIPNLEEPTIPADRDDCPWMDAKSLLCVPLCFEYADNSGQPGGETVIGLLTIASSQSYMLNDSDRTALSKLAPLVVHGLRDIATLYSRVALMEVLKREFAALGDPDPKPIDNLRVKIQRIPRTGNVYESALEAAKQFDDIVSPFLLLAQLPQWYLLLSSYNSFAPSEINTESGDLLTLGAVIDSLKPLINKFVEKQLRSGVKWDFVSPSAAYDASSVKLTIGSIDPDRLHLLKAAIFGCVSAAVTASFEGRGLRNDICIRTTTTAQEKSSIVVEYVGQPISDNQRLKPYPRHILSEQLQLHTVEIPELQLFEVGRIARFLDGELTIGRPGPYDIQTITLTIPSTL